MWCEVCYKSDKFPESHVPESTEASPGVIRYLRLMSALSGSIIQVVVGGFSSILGRLGFLINIKTGWLNGLGYQNSRVQHEWDKRTTHGSFQNREKNLRTWPQYSCINWQCIVNLDVKSTLPYLVYYIRYEVGWGHVFDPCNLQVYCYI